ncbi:unnamed protein product [Caenorhabditis sp. 36 PRJEB53466]|nr:unnamed protein product [Caenorhabditis sp. 36 PRJEB53466]
MQLDWVKKAGKKATPLFVHFLMIVSVGAYAIFGALVMRSLESRNIATVDKKQDFQRRHLTPIDERNIQPKYLEHNHKRRRLHDDTENFGKNSPKKRAATHIMRSIPFTLLAIADLGKFISEMVVLAKQFTKRTWKNLKKAWQPHSICRKYRKMNRGKPILNADVEEEILGFDNAEAENETAGTSEEEEELSETEALTLFLLFLVYIAFGGMMLAAYEPDMDFFKAVYFNFVTLTSIGLGDIVPRSETYMLITIIYIAIGLALTTIAIEIAADALKKLHYFGRKIENVGNVAIWFGGKKITMKALVKNLGDQFNLPTTVVKGLNLDNFVEQAIRVEEGEIETLRPPPFEPDSEKFDAEFADEPENEWIRDPTPTPLPSPKPLYRLPSLKTETPARSMSPEKSEQSLAIATPSPEESEDEELILPSPESSPIRVPTPREETSLEEPIIEEELLVREPTPPPPPPPPPSKPRPLTAAEIAAQKKKAYSEEAWRRYQEYQKQWKKFRQTQKVPAAQGTSVPGTSKSQTPLTSGISPDGTASSTRSQSIASVASGITSRSATPDSKKSSHPTAASREESFK